MATEIERAGLASHQRAFRLAGGEECVVTVGRGQDDVGDEGSVVLVVLIEAADGSWTLPQKRVVLHGSVLAEQGAGIIPTRVSGLLSEAGERAERVRAARAAVEQLPVVPGE